jgi:tetratricopeptide (TPR) repeat protein
VLENPFDEDPADEPERSCLESDPYPKAVAEPEPGSTLPLHKMAQTYFDMGRVDEAIDILHEALKYDQAVPELWSSLGWALIHLGRYAEAIGPLQRSLALKPDDIQCIKSLGLAAFALGRKESSLQSYRIALSLDPMDAEALFGMGILFVSSGDLKSAYRQYELLQSVKSNLCDDLYAKILERKELRMA